MPGRTRTSPADDLSPETKAKRLRIDWIIVLGMILIAFALGIWAPIPGRVPLLAIDNAVLVAVLLGFGGLLANLQLRLSKLEDTVSKLTEDRDEAYTKVRVFGAFVDAVGLWLLGGQKTTTPQPPEQIQPHINSELWPDN